MPVLYSGVHLIVLLIQIFNFEKWFQSMSSSLPDELVSSSVVCAGVPFVFGSELVSSSSLSLSLSMSLLLELLLDRSMAVVRNLRFLLAGNFAVVVDSGPCPLVVFSTWVAAAVLGLWSFCRQLLGADSGRRVVRSSSARCISFSHALRSLDAERCEAGSSRRSVTSSSLGSVLLLSLSAESVCDSGNCAMAFSHSVANRDLAFSDLRPCT